jgi:transcriptional regulator with XRE-family HTH domain
MAVRQLDLERALTSSKTSRGISSVSQRKQLGAALRSFRRDAGIDREDAAAALEVSSATLTRIERGETRLKRQDVIALAEEYGIPTDERAALLEMLRKTRMRRGQYPATFSVKARSVLDMETDATEILFALVDLIPAHFQTEDYMRALWQASGDSSTPEHIDRLVATRLARQAVIAQDHPPMFRAIVHENALRLPVGGPTVMHHQLRHLAELTDLPQVEVQIQPVGAGAYPGMGTSFTLLRFDNDTAADLVQVDTHGDSFYRDRMHATEPYRLGWDRLRVSALSLPDSKALILRVAADMERQTRQ